LNRRKRRAGRIEVGREGENHEWTRIFRGREAGEAGFNRREQRELRIEAERQFEQKGTKVTKD
jgi:hypothetical protein